MLIVHFSRLWLARLHIFKGIKFHPSADGIVLFCYWPSYETFRQRINRQDSSFFSTSVSSFSRCERAIISDKWTYAKRQCSLTFLLILMCWRLCGLSFIVVYREWRYPITWVFCPLPPSFVFWNSRVLLLPPPSINFATSTDSVRDNRVDIFLMSLLSGLFTGHART